MMTRRHAITQTLVLSLFLSGAGMMGFAPPEDPNQPGSALEHIQIQLATKIEGRLLTLDPYDDAIWIRYTRFYDGRRWRLVPYEAELLVYARDADMMKFFRSLPQGTMLRMTIFIDEDGHRRVVALEST